MSMPQRIHFVRHGESTANADRSVYATTPDWKVPLSDLGREQARAAGTALRQDLGGSSALGIYVSPYVRAQQTWDEMAQPLVPVWHAFVHEDVRLREQEWAAHPVHAAANNKSQTWVEAEAYGSFWYRHPSGESCSDALDRAYAFWDRVRRDATRADMSDGWNDMPTDVLVISHGIQIRLLLMALLDWTVDQFNRTAYPENCSRYVAQRCRDGRYELLTPLREWPAKATATPNAL